MRETEQAYVTGNVPVMRLFVSRVSCVCVLRHSGSAARFVPPIRVRTHSSTPVLLGDWRRRIYDTTFELRDVRAGDLASVSLLRGL
jgi:hypothetical protein